MRSRPVCAAHSRHVAERVRPPRKGKKKRGRAGWQGAEARPGTAEEALTTTRNSLTEVMGGAKGKRCASISSRVDAIARLNAGLCCGAPRRQK